jgi:hypothetical protein
MVKLEELKKGDQIENTLTGMIVIVEDSFPDEKKVLGRDRSDMRLVVISSLNDYIRFMTEIDVRELFSRISDGEGSHGSFMIHFAEAIVHADSKHLQLLLPVAKRLIQMHNLI